MREKRGRWGAVRGGVEDVQNDGLLRYRGGVVHRLFGGACDDVHAPHRDEVFSVADQHGNVRRREDEAFSVRQGNGAQCAARMLEMEVAEGCLFYLDDCGERAGVECCDVGGVDVWEGRLEVVDGGGDCEQGGGGED